jgi:DNA-binding NarL/FixJ family response regulator
LIVAKSTKGGPVKAVATPSTSVAVAAPDAFTATRISSALGDDAHPVETGESASELLRRCDGAFDVLVVCCDTFGPDEASTIGTIRREAPDIRVVLVCTSANGKNVRRAIDTGIDGLVLEDQVDEALAVTIRTALAGQVAVPRELRAGVVKPSLSFREKQILGLVVMGFTNGEIGNRLYLAESTVKSHLSSAFNKLGVRSRSEAAAIILDPHGSLGTGILSITSEAESPAI